MQPPLITFDAYAALCDYRRSLLPVVRDMPGLDAARAGEFLELWRSRQLDAAALSNALDRGRLSFHQCTAIALDYALDRYGLNLKAPARDSLVRAWYALEPWPEADEVLAKLSRRGYPLAILSNGDADMLAGLAAGFETPFQHVFSSEHCGRYKPHPDIYALPVRSLEIDDYLHVAGSANDVVGAKSAGISCYWSNRHHDQVLLPNLAANHQGADLRDLLELV